MEDAAIEQPFITSILLVDVNDESERDTHLIGRIGNLSLHITRGDNEPLTDVIVLYDDERPPHGYEIITPIISESGVSLCVSRNEIHGAPIVHAEMRSNKLVRVNGAVCLQRDLCRTSQINNQQFFVFVRVKDDNDCLSIISSDGQWSSARILQVKNGRVLLQYSQSDGLWDEWLNTDSSRLSSKISRAREVSLSSPDARAIFTADSLLVDVLELSIEQQLSDESKEFVFQNNAQAVLDVLKLEVDIREYLPMCGQLLMHNVDWILTALTQDSCIDVRTLTLLYHIFGGNERPHRLFMVYGVDIDDIPDQGAFAVRPIYGYEGRRTSSLLINLINYFGENNGFNALLSCLTPSSSSSSSSSSRDFSLQCTHMLIQVALLTFKVLTPEFSRTFSPRLQKALLLRIEVLSNADLQQQDRDRFGELMDDADLLAKDSEEFATISVYGDDDDDDEDDDDDDEQHSSDPCYLAARFIEICRLTLALRLISCPFLSQQLLGLTIIVDTAEQVQQTSCYDNSTAYSGYSSSSSLIYLTSRKLVAWISRQRLLDMLLVQASHQEILRRTSRLLKFLAISNALTTSDIGKLWACSIGKHEVIVRAVYDAIAELSRHLNQQLLDDLFERVEHIDLAIYTEYLLDFICTLTSHSLLSRSDVKSENWVGLNIFWRLLQDDVPVSPEISSQAYQCLCMLLEQCERRYSLSFISRCIDNVQLGHSVPQSLRLAKDLIMAFYHDIHSKAQLLVELNKKYCLIDMVLKDLQRYQQQARVVLDQYDAEMNDTYHVNDVILEGSYEHGHQIAYRLEFLDFVLRNSKILLHRNHLDTLWHCLVSSPVSQSDSSRLLQWFGGLVANIQRGGMKAFSPDDAHYLFEHLLSNPERLDTSTITEEGYKCFEFFFRHCNSQGGYIINAFLDSYVCVTSFFELTGVEFLWQIAVFTRDDIVYHHASSFLICLHSRLDASLDANNVHNVFIERSMSFLANCNVALNNVDTSETQREETCAHRVMMMLTNFLKRHLHNATAKNYASALTSSSSYTHTHTTSLRSAIVDDEKYFELLMSLLSRGGHVGYVTWRLLLFLPTNISIAKRVRECVCVNTTHTFNWQNFFNPTHTLRLLYSLDVVDKYLSLPASSSQSFSGSQTSRNDNDDVVLLSFEVWSSRFVQLGGLQRLCTILISVDTHTFFVDALHKLCLCRLLRIILHFVKNSTNTCETHTHNERIHTHSERIHTHNTHNVESCFNHDTLAPRLLRIVQLSVIHHHHHHASHTHHSKALAEQHATSAARAALRSDVTEKNAEQDDAQLVNLAFTLLLHILEQKPSLFHSIINNMNDVLHSICLRGLLDQADEAVRHEVVHGLQRICTSRVLYLHHTHTPSSLMLPILIDCVSAILDYPGTHSHDFFGITANLLVADEAHKNLPHKILYKIFLRAAEMLSQRPIFETRENDGDCVLRGLLDLLTIMIKQQHNLINVEPSLVDTILSKCLFEFPRASSREQTPPPKCKTAASRQSALELIIHLCSGADANANLLSMISVVLPLHSKRSVSFSTSNLIGEWQFRINTDIKSVTGFVGLHNPGNVCYINALLQSLFMIPALRRRLLRVDCVDEDVSPEDDFFYQLQRLLGHLQESERPYCDPSAFCHALKDWDGSPIDIRVQKDTNEFLNLLFDRIDTRVKNTPHEKVLLSYVGGAFSNELIGKTCPHYSEREEPFYCITLSIQNKKSIVDSLEAFVEGEMLEGDNAYLCGKCERKVDALKRVVLKRLPPTIFFHLKRFEMNYDTMQMVKLNDRCEFPMRLDLKRFTKAGIHEAEHPHPHHHDDDGKNGDDDDEDEALNYPPSYYLYELCGVLVHSGSAHGGHYYAFAKERGSASETCNAGRWFEYNDTVVSEFDVRNIPDETFGGQETFRGEGDDGVAGSGGEYAARWSAKTTSQRATAAAAAATTATTATTTTPSASSSSSRKGEHYQEKRRNAYMLVYDRVDDSATQSISSQLPDTPPPSSSSSSSSSSSHHHHHHHHHQSTNDFDVRQRAAKKTRRHSSMTKVMLPCKIFDSIWHENECYWRDMYVNDDTHMNGIFSIITQHTPTHNENLCVPTQHDITARVFALACTMVFVTLVRSANKPHLIEWIRFIKCVLVSHLPSCVWLVTHVAAHNVDWLNELLVRCPLPAIRKHFASVLSIALERVVKAETSHTNTIQIAAPCIDTLLHPHLRFLLTHPTRAPEFFSVLRAFAVAHVAAAHYLARNNIITRVGNLLLGSESPLLTATTTVSSTHDTSVDDVNNECVVLALNVDERDGVTLNLHDLLIIIARVVVASRLRDVPRHNEDEVGVVLDEIYVLSSNDERILVCHAFIDRLLMLTHCKMHRGKLVGDIFTRVCEHSAERSAHVITVLAVAIGSADSRHQRVVFDILSRVLNINDFFTAQRFDVALDVMLQHIEQARNRVKTTKVCLTLLGEVAQNFAYARKWLISNQSRLKWIFGWLNSCDNNTSSVRSYQFQHTKTPNDAIEHSQNLIELYNCLLNNESVEHIMQQVKLDNLLTLSFERYSFVDARDSVGKWCSAVLIDVRREDVKVHYLGWEPRWDEWVSRHSDRFAVYHSMTSDPNAPKHHSRQVEAVQHDVKFYNDLYWKHRRVYGASAASSSQSNASMHCDSSPSSFASSLPPSPQESQPYVDENDDTIRPPSYNTS